jgi:DNA-directed RNA polymerase subunit beta'
LSDTALRTANAGYLTRRLVDVSQDVIITEDDCGDGEGLVITREESENMGLDIKMRIIGRYLADDLKDDQGKVWAKKGELVTEDVADAVDFSNIEKAAIRSVLNCKLDRGVCANCYGWDLGHNKQVERGTAIGVIAAQSIGEPGTQLTMRTFHTGGIAGGEDITQGLPRVDEIFETRPPKRKAFISDVDGVVTIESAQRTIEDEAGKSIISNPHTKIIRIKYRGKSTDKYYFAEAIKAVKLKKKEDAVKRKTGDNDVKIIVKEGDEIKDGEVLFKVGKESISAEKGGTVSIDEKSVKVVHEADKIKEYIVPKGVAILVQEGAEVRKGDQITDGSIDLQQLFTLKGRLETQKYIIREIQNVYSSQGQPLNDKHVEIIARQMFSRFYVSDPGDTELLPGEIVENAVVSRANEKVRGVGKEAKVERLLMGITKTSLTTDSFLSAASFQETARVLIEASVNGKIDFLEGLKENVIIGRLIPAGTGYKGKQVRADYN